MADGQQGGGLGIPPSCQTETRPPVPRRVIRSLISPETSRTEGTWRSFNRRIASIVVGAVLASLGLTGGIGVLLWRRMSELMEASKQGSPFIWVVLLALVAVIATIVVVGVVAWRALGATERMGFAYGSYTYRLDRDGQMLDHLEQAPGDLEWRPPIADKIVDSWDVGRVDHLGGVEEGRDSQVRATRPRKSKSHSSARVAPRRQKGSTEPPGGEVGRAGT